MKYVLLIYDEEQKLATRSDANRQQMYAEYGEFTQNIKAGGQYIGGNALQPTAAATTVRVRDGKSLVIDGPFAETKEQLGGYYLVEAADLDAAIKLAAQVPSAKGGAIEVRPVMSM